MSKNIQDIAMDNQQGKTYFKIGWLVGMIEGEGCITLSKSGKVKNKIGNKLSPYISITNTDKRLIDRAIEIVKSFDLPFYLDQRKYNNGLKWKDRFTIQVYGLKRSKIWLELITKYLVGKRRQAEILLEFIAQREKVLKLHPFNKPYTDLEIRLYNQIRELNSRPNRTTKPSETKRRPWQDQVKV